MGNNCCCIRDDAISKLDGQLDSLIHSKKTQSMALGDCSFCKKKDVVCFKNYGSLGDRVILICVMCDIELNREILY
jgi:hypothetical protein